jgi:PTS system mannose-specific IIA component
MVLGKQDNLHAVPLNPDVNLEMLQEKVEASVGIADTGEGVLVLVDMYGGTPANAAALGLRSHVFECLSGVNLPMVLEACLSRREMPLAKLAAHVEAVGCQAIINLNMALALNRAGSRAEPNNGGQ